MKNIPVNYITQLYERSEVGTLPTRFGRHGDGTKPQLLDDGRLSSLFVLHGELICTFKSGYKARLQAPQMIVVDKCQLRELECVGDTVVLECVESERMTSLVQSTFRAFNRPCSEIIDLNAKLQAWCATLFADLSENPNRTNDYHHKQCCELTALLLEYHPSVLGTLYIPLYACSSRCHKCTKLFVGNKRSDE